MLPHFLTHEIVGTHKIILYLNQKHNYNTNPRELITRVHEPSLRRAQTLVAFPISLRLIPQPFHPEFRVSLLFFFIVLPYTHPYTKTSLKV